MEEDGVRDEEKWDEAGGKLERIIDDFRMKELAWTFGGGEAEKEGAKKIKNAEYSNGDNGPIRKLREIAIANEDKQGEEADRDIAQTCRVSKNTGNVTSSHFDEENATDNAPNLQTDQPTLRQSWTIGV